jgi:peptide/nickel transport system permease protein
MSTLRVIALGTVCIIFLVSLAADLVAPSFYATQFRDSPNTQPSWRFLLGTDELGRDRFSRLLYGARVSLLLAPAAALLATTGAAIIGGTAGYFGSWWERIAVRLTDLFLSLPWLFLLLAVRAPLPLNVSPWTSVMITFALLGLLGWATSSRVVRAGVRSLRASDCVLQARAGGLHPGRLLVFQILPNMRPVLSAQFWISVPAFILAEANLGLLGLGVAEPLPSLGNLLRELENYQQVRSSPWMLAPLVLLVLVVGCFQIILSKEELSQ